MLTKFRQFIQKETVLCIAFLLAVSSMLFVPPSVNYVNYIDWRVIALLFCLMAVVRAFDSVGVFMRLGNILIQKAHTLRLVALICIGLCFFLSMLITNDVALITFVPFTILLLNMIGQERYLISLIVFETIAANLGSMLTPLGNPQNLYLYTITGMSLPAFILTMLPYTAISLVMLVLCVFTFPKAAIQMAPAPSETYGSAKGHDPHGAIIVYIILFVLCLLVVLHVLPFPVALVAVIVGLLLCNRKLFAQVDYCLLLTFLCFFVFVGNMKQIPAIHSWLSGIITNHELIIGILASQVISNVPAAILLSGFTTQYSALLIGVNIGGLGTLIASLASLISYKFYANTTDCKKGHYMLVFTAYNVLFLFVLCICYMGLSYFHFN